MGLLTSEKIIRLELSVISHFRKAYTPIDNWWQMGFLLSPMGLNFILQRRRLCLERKENKPLQNIQFISRQRIQLYYIENILTSLRVNNFV